MSQLFDKIKVATSKRSTFDLSHNQVTTSDFGYIIPICYRDMIPNDDFTVTPKLFTRLSPLSVPTYGRITARVHHFFVPYRILYPKWDLFISQDSSNHTVPPYFLAATLRTALENDSQYKQSGTYPRGTFGRLMANLGLNPNIFLSAGETGGISASERISAFPFLAYYRIWLDWFADSNIHDHPALAAAFNDAIQDGGSMATNTRFLYTKNACFKKDYFTSAKVSPQDGDPSRVGVDIAGFDLNPALHANSAGNLMRKKDSDGSTVYLSSASNPSQATSKIGQFTVEALRAANSLQRYMERNNFVGSKLINRLLVHFGVSPTPERLDMAEFLGGSSFDIQIGDVTRTSGSSTSGTTATAGVGFQAGKGVGGRVCDSVSYHAKEHGVFMSLLSIIPDTGYYQGVPRFFSKGVYGDPLDYFTPEFENLGFQEILNKEVYGSDIAGVEDYPGFDPDGIFGYTPRYSEYKFQNDILAGDFISATDGSTQGAMNDAFHLFRAQYYETDHPLALNENFVECSNRSNDYDRIFQYRNSDWDHFYFNINMDVKATRPMSGFGEPSLDSTNTGEGNLMNLPYGGTRL